MRGPWVRAGAALLLLASACGPSRYAVVSNPGGGELFVDGVWKGRTSSEANPLYVNATAGEHLLEIQKPAYLPWYRRVTAVAGREAIVTADLIPESAPVRRVPRGRLEVRSDPGGATVLLDGAEVGSTPPNAGVPLLLRDIPVGPHDLAIRRDGYRETFERLEVFPDRATRFAARLAPRPGWWEFPTDEEMLRRAALEAARDAAVLTGITGNRRIAIVRIRGEGKTPIENLVEDALVGRLAQAGYSVVEREDHLLVRLAHEAARGESLALDILTTHGGRDRPFLYDARLSGAADAVWVYRPSGNEAVVARGTIPPPPTRLPTADLLLAYDLREADAVADPQVAGNIGEKAVRREARVVLTLRLLDARTGEVLDQEEARGRVTDIIPERVYPRLAGLGPFAVRDHGPVSSATVPETIHLAVLSETGLPAGMGIERLADPERGFWFLRHLGEAELRAGRPEEAAVHLGQATRLKDDYETWLLVAEARMRSRKFEAARDAYLRAVSALSRRAATP